MAKANGKNGTKKVGVKGGSKKGKKGAGMQKRRKNGTAVGLANAALRSKTGRKLQGRAEAQLKKTAVGRAAVSLLKNKKKVGKVIGIVKKIVKIFKK